MRAFLTPGISRGREIGKGEDCCRGSAATRDNIVPIRRVHWQRSCWAPVEEDGAGLAEGREARKLHCSVRCLGYHERDPHEGLHRARDPGLRADQRSMEGGSHHFQRRAVAPTHQRRRRLRIHNVNFKILSLKLEISLKSFRILTGRVLKYILNKNYI